MVVAAAVEVLVMAAVVLVAVVVAISREMHIQFISNFFGP